MVDDRSFREPAPAVAAPARERLGMSRLDMERRKHRQPVGAESRDQVLAYDLRVTFEGLGADSVLRMAREPLVQLLGHGHRVRLDVPPLFDGCDDAREFALGVLARAAHGDPLDVALASGPVTCDGFVFKAPRVLAASGYVASHFDGSFSRCFSGARMS